MSPPQLRLQQSGVMQPPSTSQPQTLPFQRPASGLAQSGAPFTAPSGMPGVQLQTSQITTAGTTRMPKRLTGDAPPDPYAITTLMLQDGRIWKREPITNSFTIKRSDQSTIVLTNDLTRIHSVCLGQTFRSLADELANGERHHATIVFRLGELVPSTSNGANGHHAASSARPWKVNVRHNGRHVPFSVQADEGDLKAKRHEVVIDKSLSHKEALAKLNEGVEVSQGATCNVTLRLPTGVSAFDLTISPSPPDATLAAIAKDETNEHSAIARSLMQMPDRYRIFLHRM